SVVCAAVPAAPRSSLFPYTTLFRSRGRALGPVGVGRRAVRDGGGEDAVRREERGGAGVRDRERGAAAAGRNRVGLARGTEWGGKDRKSTRLNSSHVAISYAVFCLKK